MINLNFFNSYDKRFFHRIERRFIGYDLPKLKHNNKI